MASSSTAWITAAGYTGDIEVEIFNEAIWALPLEEIAALLNDAKGKK